MSGIMDQKVYCVRNRPMHDDPEVDAALRRAADGLGLEYVSIEHISRYGEEIEKRRVNRGDMIPVSRLAWTAALMYMMVATVLILAMIYALWASESRMVIIWSG